VVRDRSVHAEVLQTIMQTARELGCSPIDLIRSPIEGPAGNVEFLMWLRPGEHAPLQPLDDVIQTLLA
jgi:23S rRNA (cytidine1920-2'-O)/16S rRNA (cytidine1409-2'-O)-methyltransferase